MTIYFLGGGNMASAIIASLTKAGCFDICVAEKSSERRDILRQQYNVATCEILPEMSARDVLILATKPQDMQVATLNIKTNGALVLSIAAGLSVAVLSGYLQQNNRIVRIMPNTPAQIGLGVAGVWAPDDLSSDDKATVERIMQTTGSVIWLQHESDMHAIVGLSGSAPAYVFYFMQALREAAQSLGLDDQEARQLVLNVFEGASALAKLSGEPFDVLQHNVTSKGGTTHEAISTFERLKVASAIQAGVKACIARSQELEQLFKS